MVDVAELKRRHEALSATEDNKDKLIADLVSHVEKLLADLRNEKSEFTDQKELARSYKEKAKKSRDELEEEQRKKAMLSFASVLVDGDHMNFLDSFVQDGQKGGRSAAKALIEAVQGHVQTLISNSSPNIQYCIRVYANVAGLTKTYRDTGTISANDTLEEFMRGFNMENVLCDFVNAGNGKECVDVKIRAHFDRDLLNIHCQHIVFCGSADNGYARILGPHRGSNRISLVEGPPFAHELKALIPDFETTSFSTVFRSKKLPSRRVSFCGTTVTPAITPPRTPTPNYASIAKTAAEDLAPKKNSPTEIPNPTNPKLVVCKNASGQRVDTQLRFSTKSKIETLKQHKFCNQFHILGSCSYGETCTHKHVPKLEGQEVIDLMCIARLSPCQKGLGCDDEKCVSGHRCPHWLKTCTVQVCKFPHNVDTKIVAHG